MLRICKGWVRPRGLRGDIDLVLSLSRAHNVRNHPLPARQPESLTVPQARSAPQFLLRLFRFLVFLQGQQIKLVQALRAQYLSDQRFRWALTLSLVFFRRLVPHSPQCGAVGNQQETFYCWADRVELGRRMTFLHHTEANRSPRSCPQALEGREAVAGTLRPEAVDETSSRRCRQRVVQVTVGVEKLLNDLIDHIQHVHFLLFGMSVPAPPV
mmetsp:Transcript_25979/g.85514  ORF Transcript_25979/g.85514 Transcript_25979/m.85514 type:complete len:212 (+) Transcript_25979:119-754(+)